MTTVVNLRTSNYDVYIGRPGHNQEGYFGNPFIVGPDGDLEEVLEQYREYFYCRLDDDEEFKKRVLELKDKVLGCFCKPKSCHGDIIAEYVDNG